MNPDDTGKSEEDALTKQRALLDQLVTWEHELAVLNELESDLEVEKISAEVALKAAASKQKINISTADAEEIARARTRKQELETLLEGGRGEASPSSAEIRADIERMHAGREALQAWRDAPETVAAWRRPRVANSVLVIACGVALWAAFALHPVYLVLLVPLAMAIGYFTFTAQDADWVRLGAVRHFQNTRLKLPLSWERTPVDDRIRELDDETQKLTRQLEDAEAREANGGDKEDGTASELSLSMALVDAGDAYDAALANAGIDVDSIDENLNKWLDLVYENHRIDNELKQVRAKRLSLSGEAEAVRDALFRYLALENEAPPEGHADSEALRAGLERVARRPS